MNETPTDQIYKALLCAYSHFNRELFSGSLPSVLIVLQRQAKTMGYVSPKRWQSTSGKFTDELAVNPEYFLLTPLRSSVIHCMPSFLLPMPCDPTNKYSPDRISILLNWYSLGLPVGKRVRRFRCTSLDGGGVSSKTSVTENTATENSQAGVVTG